MNATLTIAVPREFWLTSNGRYHWAEKARRTRWLRQLAATSARDVSLAGGQYRVTAYVAYPKGATGRVDPNNAAPTTKALIDGCVDAGMLADDDAKHLLGPDHRRDTNTCTSNYRVRLVFEGVIV
jgi:crossover junction endodeoxyribonuclease RusA